MRVLQVKIEIASLDFVDRDTPCLFAFLAFAVSTVLVGFAPPLLLRRKFFNANRFGFVIALSSLGIGMLVVPDFSRRLTFGE